MRQYRSIVRWPLLSALVWITAACQTIEDRTAPVNTWSLTPIDRQSDVKGPTGSRPTPRADDTGRANATYLEGTGRFTGEQPSSSRQTTTQGADDGVTLNLVNVPTAQAAKTILGDILGVQYTVAPTLEGKITIQTPKPVTRTAMIELFQHALRANGATILNSNDIYKIVPADQASIGTRIQIGDTPGSTDKLGSGLRIVQLKYVAASEMRNILEPISPRGSLVRADDARNTLTLSGNASDIAGILEAIAVFDVDVMKGMSFALVPVKTSQPIAIADELKKIFASGREGPSMVQFIPNKRLSSILIISAQPQYLSRAEAWVRRLDGHAEGNEKQFFTYRVQNRRAQELVEVLQSIFSNDLGSGQTTRTARNVTPRHQEATLQSATPRSSASRQFGSSAGQFPQTGGGQDGSPTFQSPPSSDPPMGAADTNGASPMDNGQDPPRIKVATDEAKNAILIEATPNDYRRVMRVIETLDVMPNQVLIEATIAEVSLTDELKFGLRWLLKGKNADYTFSDNVAGAVSSVFPGFSYALKMANITATLNALSEVTDVNVISSPSLTVMDNKVAVLQIGDQVPIVTQSATSVLTPGAPVVNSVSYRDTGVILSITPRINESGRVMLDIEQEVSSVAPTSTSGIDSPTIRQRRVKTTVMVSDGEVLVLGGLMQKSNSVSRTQLPILGDIPIIGNAFKQKDNKIGKTELIILLSPHVMRDVQEARQVTDEFRKGLARYSSRSRSKHRSIENTVRRTFE